MIYGLPERLCELREKYGLSQGDVAKRLNIVPSNISGYERGDRSPSLSTIIGRSYVYNCSIDYLLGKKQEDTSSVMIDISEVPREHRKIILDMIDALKSKNEWLAYIINKRTTRPLIFLPFLFINILQNVLARSIFEFFINPKYH